MLRQVRGILPWRAGRGWLVLDRGLGVPNQLRVAGVWLVCCGDLATGLGVRLGGLLQGFATRVLPVDRFAIVVRCLLVTGAPLREAAVQRTRSWRVGLLGVGQAGLGETMAQVEFGWAFDVVGRGR